MLTGGMQTSLNMQGLTWTCHVGTRHTNNKVYGHQPQPHLAIVCRANAGSVKGSLAVGEAVLKAASRGQLHKLLPFQSVFTLCLCLLTPPVGLQCVGSLAAPAVRGISPVIIAANYKGKCRDRCSSKHCKYSIDCSRCSAQCNGMHIVFWCVQYVSCTSSWPPTFMSCS